MNIHSLMELAEEHQASDLHLNSGSQPHLRVHGELQTIPGFGVLGDQDLQDTLQTLASDDQRVKFDKELELDFSYQFNQQSRFRVNVSRQRGLLGMAMRRIPNEIPALETLGLPPRTSELALRRRGLLLVTGPTGSGKSTTLAAMIDYVNERESRRIVTIEDPIEYVYEQKMSVITQRQVGQDTHSFSSATKYALRQDPDIILVGEMRDSETMAACLTAAETGHLVMSTLHTNNGPQTVDRIVDSFPHHRQDQIRMQLSLTLQAVLSQLLLPRVDGSGRVPAMEVMLANHAIRNLIREGKTHQMRSVIQTSRSTGMQTIEAALKNLYHEGLIGLETARAYADDAQDLQAILSS